MEEEMLNSPTPPEKFAGLPAGSGLTLIAILGVTIDFGTLTTLLPPLKNASKDRQIVQLYLPPSGTVPVL